jgi:hypothetical protein
MKRQLTYSRLTLLSLALVMAAIAVARTASDATAATKAAESVAAKEVEMFDGMKSGDLEVKIIARNDREARVFIKNLTGQPVNVDLPEAFAAVPALAQFGGGGGGGGMGGGGGGSGGGGQSSGGGMGGGGGGMGGGGGGGMFSIPADETAKIEVATICLDHGLKIPSSSKPYKIVPADKHLTNKPEVVELLKAFGRGELDPGAAQAAAWHMNSEVSWNDLASKLTGTERNQNRSPYFSQQQIRTGMAYAEEAKTRAVAAAEEKANTEADADDASDSESSEAKSTIDYSAE